MAEFIEREALIAEYDRVHKGPPGGARKLIVDAPAVDVVPAAWISVKDRLPEIPKGWLEHPDPVLYVTKSSNHIYGGYYGENGVFRDHYFRQYADGHEGLDADDVLCWMFQKDIFEPPHKEENTK